MSSFIETATTIKMAVFDFDGVFTDNHVFVFEDGREAVRCSRADGFGLSLLKSLGVHLLVISTETNPVVSARCKKLDIKCIQGSNDKAGVLKNEAAKLGVSLREIAYIGNDLNDLDCLKIVGFPAAVSDAYPEVIEISRYITQKPGGYGAVREFCGYLASAIQQKNAVKSINA